MVSLLRCSWLTPEVFETMQLLKSAYCNGHMSVVAKAEEYFMSVMKDGDSDTEDAANYNS